MNGLILHCGAEKVSREELRAVDTPRRTKTWIPVSHYDCASLIAEEASRRGMEITSEEYGLSANFSKMFGVLKFKCEGKEMGKCLGIRNSLDKSLSLGLTCGYRIFVCDNLAFGGEQTIQRRHTSGIDIESLIPKAFDNIGHRYIKLQKDIDKLKVTMITVDDARILTCIVGESNFIRHSDVITVLNSFQNPTYEEFSEKTKWSLYNSFTEIAQKYSPAKADQCYRGLARMFNLAGE